MRRTENEAMQDEIGSAREPIQQSHTSTHIFLRGLDLSFMKMMISTDVFIKQDCSHRIIKTVTEMK